MSQYGEDQGQTASDIFPDVEAACALAAFLRENAEAIAADTVASFKSYRTETGVGTSSPGSNERNYAWALEGVLSIVEQLEAGEVDPAQYETFSVGGGDRYGEVFTPLSYFVSSRLYMSHVIAPRLWDAYLLDRAMMERLLNCLELYVQHSITANTESFLAEMNRPKAVRRYWKMGERPEDSTADHATSSDVPKPADGPLETLTSRERQIVELVARGKSNGEIAAALDIRLNTVKGHMQRIFDKLGAASRTEVALIVMRERQ